MNGGARKLVAAVAAAHALVATEATASPLFPCDCASGAGTAPPFVAPGQRLTVVLDLSSSMLLPEQGQAREELERLLEAIDAYFVERRQGVQLYIASDTTNYLSPREWTAADGSIAEWVSQMQRCGVNEFHELCSNRRYTPLADHRSFVEGLLASGSAVLWISDFTPCEGIAAYAAGECTEAPVQRRDPEAGLTTVHPGQDTLRTDLQAWFQSLHPDVYEMADVGGLSCADFSNASEPMQNMDQLALADLAIPRDSVVGVLTATGAFCTGTAVGRSTVLTAAHCLPAAAVVVGPDMERPHQVFNVIDTALPQEVPLDVALLRIDGTLRGDAVSLRSPDEASMPPERELVSVGYGARDTQGLRGAGQIREQQLLAMGWRCNHAADAQFTGCLPGWEMVIPSGGGIDTCDGDSGGPLFESYEVGVLTQNLKADKLSSGEVEVYGGSEVQFIASDALVDPGTFTAVNESAPLAQTSLVDRAVYARGSLISADDRSISGLQAQVAMCSWRQTAVVSRPVANANRRCGDGGVYVRTDVIVGWVRSVLEVWEDHV
jgi:hypothetical protein